MEAINNRRLAFIAKQKGDGDALTELEKSQLDFLNRKGAQFLLSYAVAQCLETILGRSIPNKFDIQFVKNESPFKLANEWTVILDALLPLANQLDDAFARGRITVEGVKKSISRFVGVLASIASAQKDTFTAFTKKVEIHNVE